MTPILSLSEIASGTASQTELHNQALRQLESRSIRVLSRTTTAPPGSPAEGDSYIIPAGTWAGAVNQLASFIGGNWSYYTPVEGVRVWINDTNNVYAFDGAAWILNSGSGAGTVTSVGVTAPAAGITSSGGPITASGSITLALANDLAAVEGLATTGIVRRTATDTWSAGTAVSLTAEVTGVLPVANFTTGTPTGAKFVRDDGVLAVPPGTGGAGDALTSNPLSQFAATTSAQLAGVISDETGSGALVFATSPTLVTPALGTPASGVMTNVTGTATGLTSGISNALKSATTTVDVSAATAPSVGQILTATDSTHATWQAAGGGGSRLDQITTGTADSTLTTSGTVTINSGVGAANAIGKTLTIQPGAGGATNANGGPLALTGGTGAGTGVGGSAFMTGGASTSGAGGAVKMLGGTPSTSGNGGAATVQGGGFGGSGDNGGGVTLQGGSGHGVGGAITIKGGDGAAASTVGGGINITGGGGDGSGGAVTLTGGTCSGTSAAGGKVRLVGGSVTSASAGTTGAPIELAASGGSQIGTGGAGGPITVTSGIGDGSGNNAGGNITFKTGAGSGTGNAGNVVLHNSASALATTATGGFPCIPVCAGTPTGTPANYPAGTVPMVFDSTNFKFYVYVSSAWKSVTLS